jgi:gluconate 2-dehydrogenase alpha chain
MLRSHLESRYGKASVAALTVQDWGLKYEELEPYYTLFENLFGISGEAGNVKGVKRPAGNPYEPYRSEAYPLPPLEATELGLMFRDAAAKLGYHPFAMPAANASRPYRNPDGMQLGACQYCAIASVSCASVKSSAMNPLFPLVQRQAEFRDARQRRGCAAAVRQARQRVTRVIYADARNGEEFEQPASVVVLGARLHEYALVAAIGHRGPYRSGDRPGRSRAHYCYQTTSAVQGVLRRQVPQAPLPAPAPSARRSTTSTTITSTTRASAHGGAYITANITNGRPIDTRPLPPGTPRWERSGRRRMRSGTCAVPRSAAARSAIPTATTTSTWIRTTVMPGAGHSSA